MKVLLCASLLVTLCFSFATNPVKLNSSSQVVFTTVEKSRELLSKEDDFIETLSPFDRASRLASGSFVTEEAFLGFLSAQALAWTDEDIAKLTPHLVSISEKLGEVSFELPDDIFLVKTTGDEEGGAFYTRQNAIILPSASLSMPDEMLESVLAHELFHVLSRANPEKRDLLYKVIGFTPCDVFAFPEELAVRKITNPDAPHNNYFIEVEVSGQPVKVIPILFSSQATYDPDKGKTFFEYLTLKFLAVRLNNGICRPVYENGALALFDMSELEGFFEQIGRNTQYVIHPEEILADNFSLMLLGSEQVENPEIITQMRNLLE